MRRMASALALKYDLAPHQAQALQRSSLPNAENFLTPHLQLPSDARQSLIPEVSNSDTACFYCIGPLCALPRFIALALETKPFLRINIEPQLLINLAHLAGAVRSVIEQREDAVPLAHDLPQLPLHSAASRFTHRQSSALQQEPYSDGSRSRQEITYGEAARAYLIYVVLWRPYEYLTRHSRTHPPWQPGEHLILASRRVAMADGSVMRPFLKEATVCPGGLGGSRESRGGGGFALFRCICLMTPAMMEPPSFSRSYTCGVQIIRLRQRRCKRLIGTK